jgi:hypothetical protein
MNKIISATVATARYLCLYIGAWQDWFLFIARRFNKTGGGSDDSATFMQKVLAALRSDHTLYLVFDKMIIFSLHLSSSDHLVMVIRLHKSRPLTNACLFSPRTALPSTRSFKSMPILQVIVEYKFM